MRRLAAAHATTLAIAVALPAATAEEWPPVYGEPEQVAILGYEDHAMEPDVSSDGEILFWNNSNARPPLTDIHWARRIDDTTYAYQGPLGPANAPATLDATPSMSDDGRLFFVSLREPRKGTLHWIQLGTPEVEPPRPVPITRPPWRRVQLGPEPLPGTRSPLYFAWHKFPRPSERHPEMGIGIADWDGSRYVVRGDVDAILPGVNTDESREYAPAVSADHREFYFTRWPAPGLPPEIWMAVRDDPMMPFSPPVHLSQFDGLVEAATLTADGKLYFHKKVGDRFVIMLARRR